MLLQIVYFLLREDLEAAAVEERGLGKEVDLDGVVEIDEGAMGSVDIFLDELVSGKKFPGYGRDHDGQC